MYPSSYGWFGWQSDQQVTVKPEISEDGSTWVYKGDWDGVDMVAVFVQPDEAAKCAVPQIRAYGPENWKRMDVEIEWGFKDGTQEGGLRRPGRGILRSAWATVAPLPGDAGTTMDGPQCLEIARRRRKPTGHCRCRCCISNRPTSWSITCRGSPTAIRATPGSPSGPSRAVSRSWSRDLEKGPILAPEYGFFVTKAGSGKTAREFAAELAASNTSRASAR